MSQLMALLHGLEHIVGTFIMICWVDFFLRGEGASFFPYQSNQILPWSHFKMSKYTEAFLLAFVRNQLQVLLLGTGDAVLNR